MAPTAVIVATVDMTNLGTFMLLLLWMIELCSLTPAFANGATSGGVVAILPEAEPMLHRGSSHSFVGIDLRKRRKCLMNGPSALSGDMLPPEHSISAEVAR